MPFCIAYKCDNDTHDAPADVSFHRLPLTKPDLLKQVIIEGNRVHNWRSLNVVVG